MLVLFETPGGYAIFKLLDEKKLSKTDDLYKDFETPEGANQILKLKHFEKFFDTTEALASTTAAIEGKIGKTLKKALKKVFKEAQEQILIADAKLGNAVKDKFDVPVVSSSPVQELMRCIRSQTESLLSGLPKKEFTAMALGLAHSLSRYKLKFSPDKVDVMIVQAIGLLDDLDKELNNYIMRCREWYGWHFPELGKIITDNLAFVKIVKLVGTRENVISTDLSDILTEEIEQQVKEAAEISMGTEISEDDIMNIQALCEQVIEMTQYRTQLAEYLKSRMFAVAPNLSVLLGEVIGARLIAHSGSLVNLAKQPASTLQIAGAEKALFRALKTQKNTPKYGLIYTSNIVAGASIKNRGKISRTLAAKASLASRVDALGDDVSGNTDLGLEIRAKIERHLKSLEEGNLRRLSGTAKTKAKFEKYHGKSEIMEYSAHSDSTLGKRKKESKPLIEDITPVEIKAESEESPPKKKRKVKEEPMEESEVTQQVDDTPSSSSKKKKKKIKEELVAETEEVEMAEDVEVSSSKKKKKKKVKEEPVEDEA
ncbi:unnamed protein product [Nezara viridula]|uniref:Nop domain-containing protein n=1 Tax=Nezara viridula TaxID=85310 RepID=A0A9P0GYT1_NEZVI|nr:unnamed protein product [Nezara viridula]